MRSKFTNQVKYESFEDCENTEKQRNLKVESVTSLDVGLLKSVIKPEEQSHFSLGKTQASTSFLALKT